MGQAKLRRQLGYSVTQTKDKVDFLRPEKLFCCSCDTELPKFGIMDYRKYPGIIDSQGHPGIEVVYGGICPKCTVLCFYAIGDSDAVDAFSDLMLERGVIGLLRC